VDRIGSRALLCPPAARENFLSLGYSTATGDRGEEIFLLGDTVLYLLRHWN
jgi:hypothetical protein